MQTGGVTGQPDAAAARAVLTSQMAAGNYLAAYDSARGFLDGGLDDPHVQYLSVLALARSGASDRARVAAADLDRLTAGTSDLALAEDIAALGARLEKDRALRSVGTRRSAVAAIAARRYEELYRRTGSAYPGINAATMWLIAGDRPASRRLALTIRTSCSEPHADYWSAASAAEAALVLGDVPSAVSALDAADRLSREDFAARAVTRRQLALVCEENGQDNGLLNALRNPTVVHYTGHRIAAPGAAGRFPAARETDVALRVEQALEEHDVGFGFGSLAAGSDILVAEALLRRGAELHVVLPFDAEEFAVSSVQGSGPSWLTRYRRCLVEASSVSYSAETAYLDDAGLFDLCARVAMGDAAMRARALDAALLQLAVWDGGPAVSPAGTAVDIAAWRQSGRSTVVVPIGASTDPPPPASSHTVRELRAMLFCDVAGFGALTDAQIPTFMDEVMARLGSTLDRMGGDVLLRQTWGDALYLVLADVPAAARCALALQQAVRDLDLPGLGLAALRGMRIGGHVGPVFRGMDHVRHEMAFYGSAVVRAARIEPRTPEGEIYVTHPFAALAAIEGDDSWMCEYVGLAPTAKGYGDLPMYVLRPR
jgi:adenylate cyclase